MSSIADVDGGVNHFLHWDVSVDSVGWSVHNLSLESVDWISNVVNSPVDTIGLQKAV